MSTQLKRTPARAGTEDRPVKLGIVGCGDALFRSYLPGLAAIAERVEVVAYCDLDPDRVRRASWHGSRWWPNARVYERADQLFAMRGADAIINLSPAPMHFALTAGALEAGYHVLSEKPLAGTLEQATELIATARREDRMLACAPAVMSTPRYRWLGAVVESGRIGVPTSASGHTANFGPAALHDYIGDPSTHYRGEVGPVLDQGVYLLHAVTGLLGPVCELQAFGGVMIPERVVRGPNRHGQTIHVEADDHVLIHLRFRSGALGQILSSFAVPRTRVPAIEVHGTLGTISIDDPQSANGSVHVFTTDTSGSGCEGWMHEVQPAVAPAPLDDLIASGPGHFVASLQGREPLLLTAEHALHVLEICLQARESAAEGGRRQLSTHFDRPAKTGRENGMSDALYGR